jgi:hypothetical protein
VPRYGRIDSRYSRQLRADRSDQAIYTLNLTKFRPHADPARRSRYLTPVPERYAPIAVLSSVGAMLCFVGEVVAGSADWDQVAVVGYPSRQSFIDMASRPDFQDWHVRKQEDVDRTDVMITVPAGPLPEPTGAPPVLLEIWNGQAPADVVAGQAVGFGVEGTIIGDGRSWTGARYTTVTPGTALPLLQQRPDYQALLLAPAIERWVSPGHADGGHSALGRTP